MGDYLPLTVHIMASEKIDWSKIQTVSLGSRKSKVKLGDLAAPYEPGSSMAGFLDSLPRQLKGPELLTIANRVVAARRAEKAVLMLFGAAVVKCGLSPLVNQWIDRGLVTCLATNGAGAIHDFELALAGKTSEDVGRGLEDGTFGMAEETGRKMNRAARTAAKEGTGFGNTLGRMIARGRFPHKECSIQAAAWRREIPFTVHVAIGTDIIHQHPTADGASLGAATFRDFQILTEAVADLEGGVVLHFGSAVILPEVFLKALTIVRNLGRPVREFTAANFDMVQHYRPTQNVLSRPTRKGGKAFAFTGHHELMFPLLTAAVFERLASD
jgi:hypothetical protein